MIKNFSSKLLKELDDDLSKYSGIGEFAPKCILSSLIRQGFSVCVFYDAANDQLSDDYLLIISALDRQETNEGGYIGKSIRFKDSAISGSSGKSIVVVDAEEDTDSIESKQLAQDLSIFHHNRLHIPLYTDNELVGAITCAWTGDVNLADEEFLNELSLVSVIIEKHIILSRERFVEKKINDIRSVFESSKKINELDEFLKLAVKLVRDAFNGASAAFFDLNWYSGILKKEYEEFGVPVNDTLPEAYQIGKYLTGKAWVSEETRYIVDFAVYKRLHNQEVSPESERYHKKVIGDVKTVLYEKFGTDDRQFLIRIFNRLDNKQLPFYISQRILLTKIAREFEFILNDLLLEKRLADIQKVSTVALRNVTKPFMAFKLSQETLYVEWVEDAIFIAFDKKANVVTHCYSTMADFDSSTKDSPKSREYTLVGTPVVNDDDRLLNRIYKSNKEEIVFLDTSSSGNWELRLIQFGITALFVVPFDSAIKRGAFIICIPERSSKEKSIPVKSIKRIPVRHVKAIQSYAAIIGVCIEAEESLLTSESAKRLIGSIGHEVNGPVAIAMGKSKAILESTINILDDLKEEDATIYEDFGFGELYDSAEQSISDVENASNQVSTIMSLAKFVAEESKGGGILQLHFDAIDLNEVIQAAADEVRNTVEHYNARGTRQRFIFNFNDGCKKLSPMVGDKVLLVKVFVNLFTNAVKYSLPPGHGLPIKIDVIGMPQLNQNIIQIKNFGMAINQKERETIFLPFERGYATQDRLKARRGMGLGLYLARKITHAHNGSLFLQSATPTFDDESRKDDEGWDVVFEIRLPLGLARGTLNYESQ